MQHVPSTTALAEYGPGQFEVNLAHSADALLACDQAVRFRRIVKCVARHHGMDATFLAKPYADMAGSGLHACEPARCAAAAMCSPIGRSPRQHRHAACRGGHAVDHGRGHGDVRAAGQFLAALAQVEAYVPLTADWSVNNRGAALRVPVSDAANRRLEHRVSGAEANPYLVVSWILGGILKGLEERALPTRR